MTDTLVDPPPSPTEPPPPPTVRDDELPRPAAPRKAVKRLVIVISVLAPFVVLGAIAATFYFVFWKYEPLARRHVPGNANIVVRIEAADVALFGPVRKHFGPMLFDAPKDEPASKKGGVSRADRIKKATGVNFATDVREVLVASVDATSWVVLLGGKIAKGRFVDGIESMMREDGAGWSRDGGLLLGPPGTRAVLAQAEDGTIVVGTDTDVVRAALPATDEWTRLGLPASGAVAFAVTSDAWSGVLSAAGSILPSTGSIRSVERVTGQIALGSSPTLNVRVHPKSGQDTAALAGDIERALAALRVVLLLAPDIAGEKEALAATKVEPAGTDVLLTTLWPYDGLDRGCERLATLLRPSLTSAPAASAASAAPATPAAPR